MTDIAAVSSNGIGDPIIISPPTVTQYNTQLAALAVIQSPCNHYLLTWNDKWGCFFFLGGKFSANKDASLMDTLHRELSEELPRAITLSDIKMGACRKVPLHQFSYRLKQTRAYDFLVCDVQLAKRPSFPLRFPFVWVTCEEILSGATCKNQPISPTVGYVFSFLEA